MRFRLRWLQHDLELNEGQFAVGRNASCQLSLDDPLVSRRHALFHVDRDVVLLEDLASRNGVLVNGERIDGRVQLTPGDRVRIGDQELTLLRARDDAGPGPAVGASPPHNAKLTLPKMAPAVKHVESLSGVPPMTPVVGHRTGGPPESGDVEPSMVRRADAFKLLGGVADKALAMGRAAEAERLLASALTDIIETTRAGRSLPITLVDQAARFSAKLATATSKGGWADYVIELYSAQGRPCPASVIDELYQAMRKVTAIDILRLRGYIEQLRANLPNYGPAERFLLQRLEGLERLAALR
jgi:hypothetical protein